PSPPIIYPFPYTTLFRSFLTAIGVSVLINLGTNIFLGEISFVTQSVAPILQLAVSLDYAIFLLHSFADYRKQIPDPKEAMQLARSEEHTSELQSRENLVC